MNSAIHLFPSPRNWSLIRTRCKGRSGVYAFINNINGNCYIGSAVDLYNRLRDYHQQWYLISRSHLPIIRAITKYGIDNFTLVVLEFTEPGAVISAEQAWIDTHSPEYNVLTQASSSLGFKHSEESKGKISAAMTGKPRSDEVREEMSRRQMGEGNTFFGMSHTEQAKALLRAAALSRAYDPKPGYAVTVTDLVSGTEVSYTSLRKAAAALKCTRTSLQNYSGKVFRGRYFITVRDTPKE